LRKVNPDTKSKPYFYCPHLVATAAAVGGTEEHTRVMAVFVRRPGHSQSGRKRSCSRRPSHILSAFLSSFDRLFLKTFSLASPFGVTLALPLAIFK